MTGQTIAFFGILGVNNIGNECTLQAMLHNVRARHPEARLFTISYDPEDTSGRHSIHSVPVSAAYSRGTEARARAQKRSRAARVFRGLFRRVPAEIADLFRAYSVLRKTDLLAMTGTGMLTDYSTSALGYPYDIFKWTLAAKLARCKVCFVAIGVGPIYQKLSWTLLRSALSFASCRSFRDDFSRQKLQQLGFHKSKTDPVVPDLAFSLPPAILSTTLHHESAPTLGLGLMRHIDIHDSNAGLTSDSSYDEYLTTMTAFAVWVLRRGYRLRVLQGDASHDPTVRHDFRTRLEEQGYTYEAHGITDTAVGTVDDLVAELARTDIVMSPRYHNLILALLLEKPVISISYDPKNDALLRGVGLEEYCQPIEHIDLELLKRQFIAIESKRDEMSRSIRRDLATYRRRLANLYDDVLCHVSD